MAKKSLLQKARGRPDHVRRVLEKLRQEGLIATWKQVRSRLEEPMPLGYSSAGVVLACGKGIGHIKPGDRVASNGCHAEVVSVPRHLCARIPDGVDDEHAAFTVLGAIALQGVRLARLSLGESALVIGLGLVGQLTVSLLKAAGCRVVATDLEKSKCELALQMGADVAQPDLSASDVEDLTGGLGADAVLIAAATSSDGPITLAGEAVRKKGRVVIVGAVGTRFPRAPYYFKEAEIVVSSSYGPGRYDPLYEERGRDYPAAYVRWTEQRNLQAVLDLMASGRLDVGPLITHRFRLDQAEEAYQLIEKGSEPFIGVLLGYPREIPDKSERRIVLRAPAASGTIGIGCVGAGNFARAVLIPALREVSDFKPRVICSAGGLSAAEAGRRFGFETVTTDEEAIFTDPEVDAVFVATPHHLHASQVIRSLEAGKHVFVEKPLALRTEEVLAIEEQLAGHEGRGPLLMVGFNRRFSPAARKVAEFYQERSAPLTLSFRFNAGPLPADHWIQDEELGGGRIVGEACHAIDLVTFLTGSPPVRVFAESIGGSDSSKVTDDQCFITLRHADGSVSSIGYLAGGDRAFPKERLEIFGGGKVAVIDNWREVTTTAGGRMRREKKFRQDKGHRDEVRAFAQSILTGGPAPIPWLHLRSVALASILAVRSLREGTPLDVPSSPGSLSRLCPN
ncbi:MAG TPA: bi-domain-containing oxidoreductase [Acidobacteriota bacterium]|nr:bi-domain-containing oxidoreductase [Acidobacteriota bacterium]